MILKKKNPCFTNKQNMLCIIHNLMFSEYDKNLKYMIEMVACANRFISIRTIL